MPEVFGPAFVELYDAPPFDLVIVDEGQDLKTRPYIGMVDWLIDGGMQNGNWIWFEDNQQNIYRPGQHCDGQATLEQYRPAKKRLTKNCRNAKPIASFNSNITGVTHPKCLVEGGVEVSPVFYKDASHQKRLIERRVSSLLSEGIVPEDIVILSRHTKAKSALKGLTEIANRNLVHYENSTPGDKSLRYSTIHKFKGLESKVVIVTDVDDIEKDYTKSLNYVAFSRPTSYLEVLMHEDVRESFEDIGREEDGD